MRAQTNELINELIKQNYHSCQVLEITVVGVYVNTMKTTFDFNF